MGQGRLAAIWEASPLQRQSPDLEFRAYMAEFLGLDLSVGKNKVGKDVGKVMKKLNDWFLR